MSLSADQAERERARRTKKRELETLLAEVVAGLGFEKKRGLYFAPHAPGIRRWLALQIKRDADTFSVYPNVGVRHDELHATIDRLYGRKLGAEPTLVRMLGYLMPQNSANVACEFRSHKDPQWNSRARNLCEHIDRCARPWMDRYRTLQEIFDGLEADSIGFYPAERRPTALMLLGRNDEAGQELNRELQALGGRTDPAAQQFRLFANALAADLARP